MEIDTKKILVNEKPQNAHEELKNKKKIRLLALNLGQSTINNIAVNTSDSFSLLLNELLTIQKNDNINEVNSTNINERKTNESSFHKKRGRPSKNVDASKNMQKKSKTEEKSIIKEEHLYLKAKKVDIENNESINITKETSITNFSKSIDQEKDNRDLIIKNVLDNFNNGLISQKERDLILAVENEKNIGHRPMNEFVATFSTSSASTDEGIQTKMNDHMLESIEKSINQEAPSNSDILLKDKQKRKSDKNISPDEFHKIFHVSEEKIKDVMNTIDDSDLFYEKYGRPFYDVPNSSIIEKKKIEENISASYIGSFLRQSRGIRFGERDCVNGRDCVCVSMANVFPVSELSGNANNGFICMEFLFPSEKTKYNETKLLPHGIRECFLCNTLLTCCRYYNLEYKNKEAKEIIQDHSVKIDQIDGFKLDNCICPPKDSQYYGIIAPFLKFSSINYTYGTVSEHDANLIADEFFDPHLLPNESAKNIKKKSKKDGSKVYQILKQVNILYKPDNNNQPSPPSYNNPDITTNLNFQ